MQDASQVPADLAADDAPVQALRRAPVQGPLFVEFVKGAKTPVVGTLPDVGQVEVFQRRPMSCPDGSVPWWSWCEVEKSRMKIGLRRELRGDGRMYVETRSTTGWTRLDSIGLVWLGSLEQKPQGPRRHLLCRDVRTTLSWPGNGIISPVFPRKPGWKVACQSLCVLLRHRRFKTCFKSLKALRACSLADIDWRWLNTGKAHWMANLMLDEGFSWNFRIFLPLQLFFAKFSQLWGLEMMDLPPQKCEA